MQTVLNDSQVCKLLCKRRKKWALPFMVVNCVAWNEWIINSVFMAFHSVHTHTLALQCHHTTRFVISFANVRNLFRHNILFVITIMMFHSITKHSSFDSFFPSSSSSCSVSMVALMWLWWLHSLFFDRFNCICACAPIFCSVYSMLQALPSSTNLQFDTSHDGKNAINLQQYAKMNNDNDDNKHNEPHQR